MSSSAGAARAEVVLRLTTFGALAVLGFAVRLFAIIRYESIIHEFDPWFNFRSTKLLVDRGPYAFWNWFDDRSWFPLGRIVGGTVYPGIMFTAALIHRVLHALHLRVDIREVCVLTAPIFSSLTALAAFALTAECDSVPAGLVAAAMVVITPGYMSRSVAGSYDNEAVAITAMVATFFAFLRAVNTGSIRYAALASLVYMYMVSTWGGYVFIINLVPIYVVLMLVFGRYSHRLYVAYSIFYVLGTLLSMQIRFVGFNAVRTGEHMAAAATFALLNLYAFTVWVRSITTPRQFRTIARLILTTAAVGLGALVTVGMAVEYFGSWEGRFRSLLDPTFAKRQIPLIASVSEHQPTSWDSILFSLHAAAVFAPVGLYYIFSNLNDTNLFLVVYCLFAVYFVGVMVRLLLVLAPIAVVLTGIGFTHTITPFVAAIKGELSRDGESDDKPVVPQTEKATAKEPPREQPKPAPRPSKAGGRKGSKKDKIVAAKDTTNAAAAIFSAEFQRWIPKRDPERPLPLFFSLGMIVLVSVPLFMFVQHGVWTASEAYSSPSVVLSSKRSDGSRMYIDDYREAYYWLRQNTPEDAKILSWWDYGYQIAGFSNRTTVVDNNTWNNTHIGMVGRVLNSPEDKAYAMCTKLDVDYVLIIFGGLIGYSGDDINKFLWPVRISRSVDPSVRETDYLTSYGGYSIGDDAGEGLKQSIMYKLSYYRFVNQNVMRPGQGGFDRVRQRQISQTPIKLQYFEEALTTKNWLVRVYRVRRRSNRGSRTLK